MEQKKMIKPTQPYYKKDKVPYHLNYFSPKLSPRITQRKPQIPSQTTKNSVKQYLTKVSVEEETTRVQ